MLSLLLIGLYHFPYEDGSFPRQLQGYYLRGYARVTAAILRIFDGSVATEGIVLHGRRATLMIARSCDAGEIKLLLVTAILAFPATWRWRLIGVGAGLALVFVVNLARLCSLYWIMANWPGAFDLFHADIWPVVLVLFCAAAFLWWAYRAERGIRVAPPA